MTEAEDFSAWDPSLYADDDSSAMWFVLALNAGDRSTSLAYLVCGGLEVHAGWVLDR